MHLTLGILRTSQAVSHALSFFWMDGFAVPAPAQVTQTVGWTAYASALKNTPPPKTFGYGYKTRGYTTMFFSPARRYPCPSQRSTVGTGARFLRPRRRKKIVLPTVDNEPLSRGKNCVRRKNTPYGVNRGQALPCFSLFVLFRLLFFRFTVI